MFITFLSDFGLQDAFVGTCHGVMKRIAPNAQIIDITHGIAPQSVMQGALVLADTIPYMPAGVHLAVVDPGVGSARRPLVLRSGDGRLFVGPDNGLLVPAAECSGGIADARELANPAYALPTVSRTFHGRDLFAPAAAHLASGVAPAELGPPIDPELLVQLDLPAPHVERDVVVATALYADRFGNVALNISREHLEQVGVAAGTRLNVEVGGRQVAAVVARTFSDATPGELVIYEDANRNLALAINRGSAAEALGILSGQSVVLRPDRP